MSLKNSVNVFIFCMFLSNIMACKQDSQTIEKIDFTSDYKFNQQIQDNVTQDTVPWKYQISASDYATKGNYRNALSHWDLAMGGRERNYTTHQIDSINQKYTKVNAINYIIDEAKKTQVVIINEAHHNSFHRAFTKSLLKDLYALGYRNLGLEALANGTAIDSLLNERKYPIQETGYYTKDPQFGNLIRTALDIGYTVFSYEQTADVNGKLREIEQAKNIHKFIQEHPNEKVLIHCGFDHALEGNHTSWEKAMTGRLAEYTGINPLTINQVVYSEKGNPKFNHPLLKALDIEESSVLLDENNEPFSYKRRDAWSDIAIFHPNTEYITNRPKWLFNQEYLKVPITLSDIDIEYPVMVLAYLKGEDYTKAVPIDLTEVNGSSENCILALPKGIYQIIVTNGTQSYTFQKDVK